MNVISGEGETRHLENRLMQTLVFLAENQGDVITREEFFESVWQGRVVNEEALSRAISLLRTALHDNAHSPEYIQTIPGVGYRLIANVVDSDSVPHEQSSESKAPPNSIAVLPFVNLSSDPDNEYFSDGISEEILNVLAQVDNFKVVGRTSAFAFKGKNEDLRTIGKKLGVSHVLEGSIRKAGIKVRITAQLIKADDGYHLWSMNFDKTLEDIFAVQDEIAEAVVTALKDRLLGDKRKTRETKTEAYALYLQARYFLRSGQGEIIQKALDLFKQVVAIDADYVPAWVGISEAYRSLMSYGLLAREAGIELAFDACTRALDIDDQSAEALVARAKMFTTFFRDWGAAENDMARAKQIAPDSPLVLLIGGHLASNQGRFHESTALLKRAIEMDPLNTTGHIWLAHSQIALDQLSEARETLQQALDLKPQRAVAHMNLGKILLAEGKLEAAHEEMLLEPPGVWRFFGLAKSLYANGMHKEADEAFTHFAKNWSDVAQFQVAELHALRNERDEAFRMLDAAFDGHDNGLSELFESRYLRVLYDDPRWPAFVAKMGLEWPLP
jgi:TolB-like protein/lipoprotein NlpI